MHYRQTTFHVASPSNSWKANLPHRRKSLGNLARALQTPSEFHARTPKRQERTKIVAGEGKKRVRNFGRSKRNNTQERKRGGPQEKGRNAHTTTHTTHTPHTHHTHTQHTHTQMSFSVPNSVLYFVPMSFFLSRVHVFYFVPIVCLFRPDSVFLSRGVFFVTLPSQCINFHKNSDVTPSARILDNVMPLLWTLSWRTSSRNCWQHIVVNTFSFNCESVQNLSQRLATLSLSSLAWIGVCLVHHTL